MTIASKSLKLCPLQSPVSFTSGCTLWILWVWLSKFIFVSF